MRLSVASAAIAATVLVVTGCAQQGVLPRPEPGLPPRPVAVDADRIPPCSMLTTAQVSALELRLAGPGKATVDGRSSQGCSWFGVTIDYNVQLIPIDAQAALSLPGAALVQVNGFGAVRSIVELPGNPPICQLAVDAAPERTIRIQASPLPGRPATGEQALCRRAAEAASMVMTTLVDSTTR